MLDRPSIETPLNVLLVEDDDGDAKAIERAFQKARIASPIQRAIDGVEALEILRGTHSKIKLPGPSILIVDINLPRMDGIQLVKEIRGDHKLHRSLIFVLTTSRREKDKAAVYDLNVAGYIVKAKVGPDFLHLLTLLDSYSRTVEIP